MLFSLTESDKSRFWEKVDKSGKCWIWNAARFHNGYGTFSLHTKTTLAHRVSFLIANGSIPNGMCVLHKCDVKNCVRPSHLFIGTMADNMRDRDMKGRQAKGDRNGLRLHPESRPYGLRNGHYTKPECTPRGVNAGNAKLTDEKVEALRLEYRAGGISQDKLAAKYGICQSVTSGIILRQRWKHVT